jgi:membrane-associated protein
MILLDLILNLDKTIGVLIGEYGAIIYLIIAFIVFLETGFVFAPFLPGDSLLFTAGAFAAIGELNLPLIIVLLLFAAILGDGINYLLGKYCGRAVKKRNLIRKEYFDKTERFFYKYGSAAVVIARFFPIIRTITPFIAGGSRMPYGRFLIYNVIGAVAWIFLFTFLGYFFGNIPFVRENLSFFVLGIISLSVIVFVLRPLKNKFFPAN